MPNDINNNIPFIIMYILNNDKSLIFIDYEYVPKSTRGQIKSRRKLVYSEHKPYIMGEASPTTTRAREVGERSNK